MTEHELQRERNAAKVRRIVDVVAFTTYFSIGICIAFDILRLDYAPSTRLSIAGLFIAYSLFRAYRFFSSKRIN